MSQTCFVVRKYTSSMQKALRGINIGGWLVLEKWMTPSVFAGTDAEDEWSLGQELGEAKMRERLQMHRASWITEQDIAWLAKHDFEVLRLPVGYWILEDRDGFYGGLEYVDRLFDWAQKYGIKVILDLHSLPGFQNKGDHSGRIGICQWHTRDENIIESLVIIRRLGERYGNHPALYAVEVINEPDWDIPIQLLAGFYNEAYKALRDVCGDRVMVIVSDAFKPAEMVKALKGIGLTDVILDCHMYQLFSDEDKALDFDGHIAKVGSWQRELAQYSQHVPLMIGEWSAALDLAKLAGKAEREQMDMIKRYYRVQQAVFDKTSTIQCYWTYKTEGKGPWSYRDQSDFRA